MILPDAMGDEPWIVALDAQTGRVQWEKPFEMTQVANILYLVAKGERLFFVGSESAKNRDAHYHVMAMSAKDGQVLWKAEHFKHKPGHLYHGEEAHHPVVLFPPAVIRLLRHLLASSCLLRRHA